MQSLVLLWLTGAAAAQGVPEDLLAVTAYEVPITVDGQEVLLPVPAGADADAVARQFGVKYGLDAGGISTVARTVLSRGAELSGKSLAYVLPISLGGADVHLPVYAGATHEELASAFVQKHELDQAVAPQLVGAMVSHEKAAAEQQAAAVDDTAAAAARAEQMAQADRVAAAAQATEVAALAEAARFKQQQEERKRLEEQHRLEKEQAAAAKANAAAEASEQQRWRAEQEAKKKEAEAAAEEKERADAQEKADAARASEAAAKQLAEEEVAVARKEAAAREQVEQEAIAKAKIEAFKAQRAADAATSSGLAEPPHQQQQKEGERKAKQVEVELAAAAKKEEAVIVDALAEVEKMEMLGEESEQEEEPEAIRRVRERNSAQAKVAAEARADPQAAVVKTRQLQEGNDRLLTEQRVRLAEKKKNEAADLAAIKKEREVDGEKPELKHYSRGDPKYAELMMKQALKEQQERAEASWLPGSSRTGCTTLGCAVREKFGESGQTGMIVMSMVLGTIGACVLLDQWGIEETWCCKSRPASAEEITAMSTDPLLIEAEALAKEEALEERYGKGKVPTRLRVRVGDHPLGMGAGEDDDVDLSCGVCSTDAGAAAAMELELAAIEAAMLSPRSSGTASEASEYV